MVHLYKAILKERMNPAAAIRAAQLELLNGRRRIIGRSLGFRASPDEDELLTCKRFTTVSRQTFGWRQASL